MANRLFLIVGLATSLAGCNFRHVTTKSEAANAEPTTAERKRERQRAKELVTQDSLNKRYPERVKKPAPVVVHDTVRAKPKTEYVYVKEAPARPLMEQVEADSLLAHLYKLTERYKENLEFRAELASVKSRLTQALKKRSSLRDTVVYFPLQGMYLEVKELSAGRFQYILTESAGHSTPPPASQTPAPSSLLVTDDRKFYEYREYWLTVLAFGLALITVGTVKKYDICRRIRQHHSRRLKTS